MSLLLGTEQGLYHAPDLPFDQTRVVLDAGRVNCVRHTPNGTFAATDSGLFRSTDGGAEWTDLGVPQSAVYAVTADPNDDRLYAGTQPARLYAAALDPPITDDSWRELPGFYEVPSRDDWRTPRHDGGAQVRSLAVHTDAPDRLVAGVEIGGVYCSDDRGETWSERRIRLDPATEIDDVHHVLVRSPDQWIASTGNGLYRTDDAGREWHRLDDGLDRTYFREALDRNEHLYAAAAVGPPGEWEGDRGADGALFRSVDGGETVETIPYPGQPEELILSWSTDGDTIVAGTNAGRVLGGPNHWETAGMVPAPVRSVAVVP